MRHLVQLLTLAVALLVPAAAPLAQELKVTDRPIYPDEVPPGTREDQLLFQSLRAGTTDLREQVAVAGQVLFEAHTAALNLEELEKGGGEDEKRRVAELRAGLDPRWNALRDAIPRTNVLGCRYTLVHLEDSMVAQAANPETEAAKRLPLARTESRRCDGDTRATLARLAGALGSLRRWLDETGPEIRERRSARGLPPLALEPPGVKLPAAVNDGGER
jgi:hypothetical protein